ncbi:MAG: ATP-dependent helicase, partial [Cyanobacteria bacterium P01_D01_bin.115]
MSSDSLTQQQTLQQTYRQLTSGQRSLVQVFALLYEPTSRDKAYRCWKAAISQKGAREIIQPLEPKQFSNQVKALIDQGLLTQARAQGARCPKLLVDIVVRDAVKIGTFEPIAQAIRQQFPIRQHGNHGPRAFYQESEFMRELRIAIYRQDRPAIDSFFEDLRHNYWHSALKFPQVLHKILTNPFDADWVINLSDEFRQLGLSLILEDSVQRFIPANGAFEVLEEIYDAARTPQKLCLLYAEQLWLRGHLDEASTVLASIRDSRHQAELNALLGAIAFLKGHTADSIAHYRAGLKAAGKSQTAQVAWFNHPATVLFFFALLKDGSPTAQQAAEQYVALLQRQSDHWLQAGLSLLLAVLQTQQGRLGKVVGVAERFSHYDLNTTGLATLIEIYSLYWLDVMDLDQSLPAQLAHLYHAASQAGYGWIALEVAELMTRFQSEDIYAEISEALREEIGSQPLIEVIQRQEMWELSLNALTNLTVVGTDGTDPPPQSTFRMAWKLRFSSSTNWGLTPLEQKFSVKGGWTKGKSIALKRLRSGSEIPPYLTSQDRRICDTLEVEYEDSYSYYRSKPTYSFGNQALAALVGHPLVFWEDTPNVRVDVVAGEPELLVKRLRGDRLRLELSPALKTHAEILAIKETPTRLKVIPVSFNHRRIAEVLGPKNRLEVPAQAQDQVLQAIASVASLVTVQSDIGGGVEAEEVPADATPRVHLLPAGEGLKVSLLTHPFPEGGSYYPPGKGGQTVIAEVDGKRLQTQRDLKAEKQRAKDVIAACPVFEQYKADKGEWLIEETADCLELLLQLQALGDRIMIEWPEGEKFRVSRQLGLADFKLSIRRQKDWFAASGEVQISEDQVLDIQHLMQLLAATPGQFVKLSDGQFLALTDEFRKRLQTLNRLSESHSKGLRVHGLAALALDDMVEDVEQLKVDKAWKVHLNQIKAARTIEPQVPAELQATLRDYQCEGYTWLARLAH